MMTKLQELLAKVHPAGTSRGRVSLYPTETGIACAAFEQSQEGTSQAVVDCRQLVDPEALTHWVHEFSLRDAKTTLVLPWQEYQLLMLEALDVPEDELHAAVRWRIKDLISYPVEEAIVDVMPLPPRGFGAQKPMLYVVVSRLSALQDYQEQLSAAGLRLQTVTIAELALRNYGLRLPTAEKTYALMAITENGGLLSVFQGNLLHYSRQIKLNVQQFLAGGQEQEEGVLEIQRSFDYCQTELHLPTPTDLYLLPPATACEQAVATLDAQQNCRVTLMDLTDYFTGFDSFKSTAFVPIALALGGGLLND